MNPEKIGKYTVIELLGRGGMGEVYLGEDPYIGRRVAIKVIKGADPEARDRFLHEARVIGGLTHPAIVSLLDFDFSGNEPFLVMEYLKGQGMDAWIKNPHSLSEQLVVLEDICHALSYAHENGVLHRDVKPSNVQILPNGHAKLMDFGIARAAAGKLTATGSVMGTPEYMAPEILNDAAYSPRSDLYACAVLLYEMFTGTNPFAAKTVAAALTNVLTLNPPHVRAARPDMPKRLADTLMACLHKEPALRPDGFGALLAASREAVSGESPAAIPETRAIPTVGAPPPSKGRAVTEPAPGVKTTRWAWMGGAAAAVVLGMWLVNRGATPTAPALPSTASPGPTPTAVTATPHPVSAPPASPTPEREAAPTPKAARVARDQPGPAIATPPRPEPTATPMPAATSAPSFVLPAATPTPQPRPSASAEPASIQAPLPAAPGPPVTPVPVVSSVSPRTVRRGSSVDLEISGTGLRKDLKAMVLQGRRPATGIKVLKQDFVSSGIIRLRVLIEAETPLLTYAIVFQDASGVVVTQGIQIEVVL